MNFIKNLFKTAQLCLVGLFLSSSSSYGHGEDKPGPHKGFIQMPGAFHIELVPVSNTEFKVYLLDIEWKNPIVKNSEVQMRHSFGKRSFNAACKPATPEADYFSCVFPEKINTKRGNIEIKATRDSAAGNLASYKLPLSFKSLPKMNSSKMAPAPAEPAKMDHSGHH